MLNLHVYLIIAFCYIVWTLFVFYVLFTQSPVSSTIGFIHFLSTLVFVIYVIIYRRHKQMEDKHTRSR